MSPSKQLLLHDAPHTCLQTTPAKKSKKATPTTTLVPVPSTSGLHLQPANSSSSSRGVSDDDDGDDDDDGEVCCVCQRFRTSLVHTHMTSSTGDNAIAVATGPTSSTARL